MLGSVPAFAGAARHNIGCPNTATEGDGMTQRQSTAARVRVILDEQGCGDVGVLIADVISAVAVGGDADSAYRALVAYHNAEHAAYVATRNRQ